MKINFNNKTIEVSNVKKCNWFEMFRGLMFRRRENAPALLLFDFKKPLRMKIHSWFVSFQFIAIWLDDKNKIIELKVIKPWRFFVLPKKSFYKLLEIPINKKYKEIVSSFVTDGFPKRFK